MHGIKSDLVNKSLVNNEAPFFIRISYFLVILQSSGVQVDQDVIDAFKEIKSKKSHAYVVMKIEDKKKIVVEKKGSKLPPNCSQTRNEEIFNEMKNSLGEEPRYIVFDFCFTRSNQTVSQPKLTFISW